MSEQKYPNYVQKMIEEARRILIEDEDACEAAAACFDILALFPEQEEAKELIQRAYRGGNLIRDNRRALSRLIDEWDDRPWQQQRRLSLSFGYVSRWEDKYYNHLEDAQEEPEGPADVNTYLHTGHLQLLEDYLGGQAKGAESAWQIFQEAIRLSNDPHETMICVLARSKKKGLARFSTTVLNRFRGTRSWTRR